MDILNTGFAPSAPEGANISYIRIQYKSKLSLARGNHERAIVNDEEIFRSCEGMICFANRVTQRVAPMEPFFSRGLCS